MGRRCSKVVSLPIQLLFTDHGLYLSRLLQVTVVGGDRREDRNHCQLNISAGKPLWGLLQALRDQPISHLQAQR